MSFQLNIQDIIYDFELDDTVKDLYEKHGYHKPICFQGQELRDYDIPLSDIGLSSESRLYEDVIDDSFQGVEITGDMLKRDDFRWMNFDNVDISDVIFTGNILFDGVDFRKCKMYSIQLNNCSCIQTIFDNNNLSHCIFRYCNFKNASFYKTNLESVKFVISECIKVNFKEAKLDNTTFNGVILKNCDFDNSTLYNCDIMNSKVINSFTDINNYINFYNIHIRNCLY